MENLGKEETRHHKNFRDQSGKVFSNWVVLSRASNSSSGHSRYFCKCSCGQVYSVLSINLTRGLSKCCVVCSRKNNKTHGLSNSKTYNTWVQMIERCHNPKHPSFHNYGKRSIQVCERWRISFSHFVEDMGISPKEMSIERIDNSGNYEKSNCRWATWKEQCRNKRNSIKMGDVYSNWKIMTNIENKKYTLKCINCGSESLVISCNVRNKKPCKCTREKSNENIRSN